MIDRGHLREDQVCHVLDSSEGQVIRQREQGVNLLIELVQLL